MRSSAQSTDIGYESWRTDFRAFSELTFLGASEAVRHAIAAHHREGRAVPIWHDGRVMWLHPGGEIRAEAEVSTDTVVALAESAPDAAA